MKTVISASNNPSLGRVAKIALAVAVFTLCAFRMRAQEPISNDQLVKNAVDSLFYGKKGFEKTDAYTGAEIGIFWKGKTWYFSYGYADKENGVKVDTGTIFEIGSNTKVFTGLLLATEMSKGTINASTKIDDYLPVNSGIKDQVRILDLATFTSGLPTLHDSLSWEEIAKVDSVQPLLHVDNAYLLSLLRNTTSLNNYGQYDYSNYSYSLLGYLLSDMNKKSYENLLGKRVLKPLNLVNTTTVLDTDNVHLARGYDGGHPAPYLQLTGMASAGILKSNVTDMLQFLGYQLGKPSPLDDEIALSQQKFYTNDSLGISIGLTWHITNLYGDQLYAMRGDTYGFSSMLAFDKNEDLGIVILTNTLNSDEMEKSFTRILRKIKESEPEYKKKFEKPVVKLDSITLQRYTGSYEVTPDFIMNVFTEGNEMYIQCTGQPKAPIDAVGETTFESIKYKAEFDFVNSAGAGYDKVVLHQNGQAITAVRVKDGN